MMCVDLKRHFNWLKVAVMAVLAVMVMMFVLTGTQSAYAGTDNKTYVIDDAGILTSDKKRNGYLHSRIQRIMSKNRCN